MSEVEVEISDTRENYIRLKDRKARQKKINLKFKKK